MANSLLDFVMSLVRDPDAAARYAADPAQALADAHLTDVTSADVSNLIPVVAESLSMGAPSAGLDAVGVEAAGNVWASGAATAAFDAFSDPTPMPGLIDAPAVVTDTVEDGGSVLEPSSAGGPADDAASLQLEGPVFEEGFEEGVVDGAGLTDEWVQPVVDTQPGDDPGPGFDIFS
ncbi:MAG: Rv0340 family IniB-related protein [Mycobacterium sp.]